MLDLSVVETRASIPLCVGVSSFLEERGGACEI